MAEVKIHGSQACSEEAHWNGLLQGKLAATLWGCSPSPQEKKWKPLGEEPRLPLNGHQLPADDTLAGVPLAPAKPSDASSPGWHVNCNLMGEECGWDPKGGGQNLSCRVPHILKPGLSPVLFRMAATSCMGLPSTECGLVPAERHGECKIHMDSEDSVWKRMSIKYPNRKYLYWLHVEIIISWLY